MKTLVSLFTLTVAALAQQPITLMSQAQTGFNRTHDLVLKAAEKMPDDAFGFKPTPDVRSFGALVGHIAETNFFYCSSMKGEENPGKDIETKMTTKVELVKAMKDVKAYCGPIVNSMTAESIVSAGPRKLPGLGLVFNMSGHTWEHYGNMVTYMRLKGIVPPSSEK
ncbi:MAG: DinB family protein [Bryobacteraceae bacterium]